MIRKFILTFLSVLLVSGTAYPTPHGKLALTKVNGSIAHTLGSDNPPPQPAPDLHFQNQPLPYRKIE